MSLSFEHLQLPSTEFLNWGVSNFGCWNVLARLESFEPLDIFFFFIFYIQWNVLNSKITVSRFSASLYGSASDPFFPELGRPGVKKIADRSFDTFKFGESCFAVMPLGGGVNGESEGELRSNSAPSIFTDLFSYMGRVVNRQKPVSVAFLQLPVSEAD